MGFFDNMLHRFGLTTNEQVKALNQQLNTLLDGSNPMIIESNASALPYSALTGEYSADRQERLALLNSWVSSNIDMICNIASESNFELYQNEKLVKDNPILNVIRKPNEHYSYRELVTFTATWLLLRGEAYWLKVYDGKDELTELWPIPMARITPHQSNITGKIEWYNYRNNRGEYEQLDPKYVLYFKSINPFNPIRGIGKIQSLITTIEGDMYASRWNLETFTNEATLTTLISLNPSLQKNVYAQVKSELMAELVNKRKRFLVARTGDIDVKSIGLAHKELEYLSGRAFNRDEIDRKFGFPTGFWKDSANRANMLASKETVIEHTVWPLLLNMANAIEIQLFSGEFTVKPSEIRPSKFELEQGEYEVLTIDEVRNMQGKEPHWNSDYGKLPYPLRNTADAFKLLGLLKEEPLTQPEPQVQPQVQQQTFAQQLNGTKNGKVKV